ncbi:hypothetical protein SDC9_37241 [bioreactor metagenome]|uniref:Uncharacterized protein n=1 Tax=bioreactor metagenome TaxID=1076179 RepID=A0A644VIN7_9ZZZZ
MACSVGDEHAEEGAHGHDPFAAEVEHAGPLVEHLAERGEQEGNAEGNAEGEDVDGEVHEITPPCCGLSACSTFAGRGPQGTGSQGPSGWPR